eukprot:maker-scaffold534_size144770-snap-gene-0.31 protein:Tk11143 transcript:maker-scaffold534_size144770-snap-gene-0.31-mRNA-1 annotation:"PREDICTED: uncharacterized protein LOC100897996"
MDPGQQFCLRWNNHQKNITCVFDRLRDSDLFTDVSLVTADQKSIKCHKLILSAGSGFLEDILCRNPSEHPTIVLSQINHAELLPLVDFMYNGEVAVEQSQLQTLLEAANILKIKGLWENGSKDAHESEMDGPTLVENARSTSIDSILSGISSSSSQITPKFNGTVAKVGSQKRKRKLISQEDESKQTKLSSTPNELNSTYSPLFGVSNAYFLSEPSNKNKTPSCKAPGSTKSLFDPKDIPDVPNLMAQVPMSPGLSHPGSPPTLPIPAFLAQLTMPSPPSSTSPGLPKDKTNKAGSPGLLCSAPVRRYKKYTEDMLQEALRDIIAGKSINSSSNKFNIPARTLRDWMKRLNIKSVFTHHSQKDSRSASVNSEISENSESSSDHRVMVKTEAEDSDHHETLTNEINKENQTVSRIKSRLPAALAMELGLVDTTKWSAPICLALPSLLGEVEMAVTSLPMALASLTPI